jgi:hypothetical protein
MQAHYLPLRGLEKLLQTVHLVSQSLNPSIRVSGILLCMHDGSSSHARAVISEIEEQLGRFRAADVPWSGARVLHPPVRRNIKLAEAPSFGQTIFDYAPRCPGADDYRDIVRSLLESWGLPHGEFDSGLRRRARKPRAPAAGAGRAKRTKAAAREPRRARAKRGVPAKADRPAKGSRAATGTRSTKTGRVPAPARSAKPGRAAKLPRAGKRSRATNAARPAKSARSVKSARPSKSARPAKPRGIRSGGLSL